MHLGLGLIVVALLLAAFVLLVVVPFFLAVARLVRGKPSAGLGWVLLTLAAGGALHLARLLYVWLDGDRKPYVTPELSEAVAPAVLTALFAGLGAAHVWLARRKQLAIFEGGN